MAVSDAYATAATYRTLLGKTDTSEDSEILDDLLAISRYIEWRVDRFFTKDASPVARIYYPEGYSRGDPEAENPWRYVAGSRDLRVDDISTTSGLVIKIDTDRDGSFADETALATTDYQLRPLNADKGPEAKPWNVIHLPEWSTLSNWPNGSPVEVTAAFGWPSIPKAVERACVHLAGILRLESPRSTERVPEAMDAVFGMSDEAKSIIGQLTESYRRRWVIA